MYHKVGDARFALWYDDLGMWRLGDRADVGSTGENSLVRKYRALLYIDRALLRTYRALFMTCCSGMAMLDLGSVIALMSGQHV